MKQTPLKLAATLLLCSFSAGVQADELKDARNAWLHGRYDEARAQYEEVAKQPKLRVAAAIGIGRAWQSQGEYDKALAAIDGALHADTGSADLHARRAELIYLRGQWQDAEKAADRALAINKDHFLARWIRGQVFRDRGDVDKADEEFRWFARTYNDRQDNNEIKDPEELLLVGLASTEHARWNKLSDQFEVILNDVYGDALKADKNFWLAEYQAGMLLLEKYKRGEAMTAFDKALTINPRSPEALVGKGLAALQGYELKNAEQFAERALKINPRHPEALQLRADIHLAAGDVDKALRELRAAQQVNPRDEATLGRIAACFFLQHKTDEFQKLVKEVEQYDAKPGFFYYVVAEALNERRRFFEAEELYKKSTQLRPQLPWALNSLGLLYMRIGKEQEARETLTEAFKADDFNVRVGNSLKVLRHLEKYETIKTQHFLVRFDPKHDARLARSIARSLEALYAELGQKFNYQPAEPILIEVFNSHEMFSGRTVALPDLHTIGACTGRMVAMASPRAQGIRKPFNWARVLRHELVHIFNLEQTNFQVPHWFTEGLAVINEGFPRPEAWDPLLVERFEKGTLLNLDNVNLGFIRPTSADEWQLAYCQSQLYVEFMKEKYGPATVGAMLACYREGLSTEAALQKACKVDKPTFEQGYKRYLAEIVKPLAGQEFVKPMTFTQLREAVEKEPDNADLSARLAELYLVRDKVQARKLADKVLDKNKAHPLACSVKARLLLASGDEEQARKVLELAVDPKAPEAKVLEPLGKLYFEAKEFGKAIEVFERGRKANPRVSRWLTHLAAVYAQQGDKNKLIDTLKELVPADADDLASRKRLARLLADAARNSEAEVYARQALEIDVLDAESQCILGEALLAQKKYAEAIEALGNALETKPDFDDARLKLAQAYLENGEKPKASNEAAKVLARDPANAEAKRLKAESNKR